MLVNFLCKERNISGIVELVQSLYSYNYLTLPCQCEKAQRLFIIHNAIHNKTHKVIHK